MNKTETIVHDETTGGRKGDKLAHLGDLDPLALYTVAEVAGFGGQKYEQYNYAKGYKWSLSYNAMQRHLMLFWAGEDLDPESGLPHIAHAAWHALALLCFEQRGRGTDDRFPRDNPFPGEDGHRCSQTCTCNPGPIRHAVDHFNTHTSWVRDHIRTLEFNDPERLGAIREAEELKCPCKDPEDCTHCGRS